MTRFLPAIILILFLLPSMSRAQECVITEVNATALPCDGNFFMVSIDIAASNTSPGLTLAGNGTIYGTFLYSEFPITVGPFLGDDESVYSFIAWDVENPDCQQFTTLPASNCGPVCHFSNATLDSLICVNNGFALVELDFDHAGTTNPAFDVFYENGTEVGSWLYASLPVTITSFAVNGSDPIVLTICDNNNSDCCRTFEFDAIDCNPTNCEIYNVSIDPECTGGNFVVHLDFEIDNPASDSFSLEGNNLNYGVFAYTELPLTLGPLNGGTNINWVFNIKDIETPTCQESAVLGIYRCPPPCDILALEAQATLCNGNDSYALLVSLDIEGEGDHGFSIFSENTYYGSFEYDNLPITIPDYLSTCDLVDYVTVCDNDEQGCCATVAYEALLCCGCIIYNLTADPQPCNEENEIFVLLDFDFQNTSGEGFSVSGNGEQYGEFDYEDVPVLIGPFAGDGSQFLEFVVADLMNEDCFDATEIGLLSCTDICDFSNLAVTTGDCSGNDSYILTFNFDYENVSGTSFDVFINDVFFASFNYADLPVTIEDFPGSGNPVDIIRVCDNDDENCCVTLEFDAPACVCNIYDMVYSPLGCSSETTFSISLEFLYENLPGDFVDIYLDGNFIGFYSVNNIPLTVEVPEGAGVGFLTVCANDLETCCEDIQIELLNCEGPQCTIFDLVAEAGPCTSDSTFIVDIAFDTLNFPGDSVLLYANNTFIGQYQIDTAFIHIENFPVLDGNNTHLTVCADGILGCCEDVTFVTPDCDPTDCELWDLVADPGICLTDSTYTLLLVYNSENIPGDSVTVTANGNLIGIFASADHQIIIDNFPWVDGDQGTVTVCSVTFPDCCDSDTYEIPNCPGPVDCTIFDLVVNFEGCQSDSSYTVAVNFGYDNLPSDSVIITANALSLGVFPVNGGHIVLDGVPVLATDNTTFTICAVGALDCCNAFELATPYCGDECLIDISFVEIGDCQTDSTIVLDVHFQHFNLPTDSVVLVANGITIGQFQVEGGNIHIDQFPLFDNTNTEISICAAGAPDCCDQLSFDTPACGECHLFDLIAETGQCTSDTTFVLDFTYEYSNLPMDSVTVYVDTLFIGQFSNNSGSIHIENFPVLGGETTTITVCAAGAPDCCDNYTFETPVCAGGCSISDIIVDTGDLTSDSTFSAIINFNYAGITAGGFDVYAGVTHLGFFSFNQIPVAISNFPCNSSGQYVVTVCESDNLECCSFLAFEGPVCGVEPCDIYDADWSCIEGDTGTFFFVLGFNFQNVGTEGFNVLGNGNNYGNFSYANLPIQIGPFEPDNTDYEFLILDAQFNECFDLVAPGVVDCVTATTDIQQDDVFRIYNNGKIPGVFAVKKVGLTLFNSNGKILFRDKSLSEGSFFELNKLPSGMYIAFIGFEGNTWPIKLVKNSY